MPVPIVVLRRPHIDNAPIFVESPVDKNNCGATSFMWLIVWEQRFGWMITFTQGPHHMEKDLAVALEEEVFSTND